MSKVGKKGRHKFKTYSRVLFEVLVRLSIEKADFRFIFYGSALVQSPSESIDGRRRDAHTETKISEDLGIIIEYPFIVIQVDDKIRRLRWINSSSLKKHRQ